MEKDNFNENLVILKEQYAENKLVPFFVIFQTVRIISETFFWSTMTAEENLESRRQKIMTAINEGFKSTRRNRQYNYNLQEKSFKKYLIMIVKV